MLVTKRNNTTEPLDIEKIHQVLEWACDGLTGVSVSEIELKSQIQFYSKIKTSDIHETMIKSAADLISEETPNYQYVAGRLVSYHLRKQAYGSHEPPHLQTHYTKIKNLGYYDPLLFDLYSDAEWDTLNKYIKHDRDDDIVYVGMEQLRSKYLVKDRVNNRIFETPQMAMMLIAMTLFSGYKKDRLKWVKDLYDALSEFDISLPTPIMAGVRTPDRQYSSCVLIETGDSMDSINATTSAITKYVSQKAGIGIGAGRIRALMSPVRNGSTYHTGVIPFYKLFAAGVKSCNQGGVRGGSATLHVPIWHLEIEDILVLKNNRGTEETRCRQLDYSVQFNRLFYERLISDGDITLFSPNDVGDMYDYFYTDVDKFTEMYEKFERSTKIRKKVIKASELFSKFMQERKDTGRIYFMNVDHCNTHSSFTSEIAITMSNLCQEITLPTGPLDNILDENGEISQCILAAQNWGKIKSTADFERGATLIVRALNALIDYQSYPVIAGELSTKARRPLGVGIINFAYWLAKNGTNYTDANLELIHEYAEAWSYYLIKASVDLAEEYGHCDKSVDTKYHHGIFPIHTYKKDVDELVKPTYKMDWDTLIERAKVHGIMNSTLMALMPSETSSQVSNSTNGIDPIRELVAIKQSKDGVLPQVAPELTKLKNKYEKMFYTLADKTAELMALWQVYGFMHGVMNTDNFSMAGLTIDYGPYAFMDYFEKKAIWSN
jgi:ribonucleoside-diphosphate reductase alpha chain